MIVAEAVRNFETKKRPKSGKEVFLIERIMIIEHWAKILSYK